MPKIQAQYIAMQQNPNVFKSAERLKFIDKNTNNYLKKWLDKRDQEKLDVNDKGKFDPTPEEKIKLIEKVHKQKIFIRACKIGAIALFILGIIGLIAIPIVGIPTFGVAATIAATISMIGILGAFMLLTSLTIVSPNIDQTTRMKRVMNFNDRDQTNFKFFVKHYLPKEKVILDDKDLLDYRLHKIYEEWACHVFPGGGNYVIKSAIREQFMFEGSIEYGLKRKYRDIRIFP